MNKSLIIAASLLMLSGHALARKPKPPAAPTPPPAAMETEMDKVSYSIGLEIGKSFNAQEIDLNSAIFIQGLQDGLSGSEPQLDKEEMRTTLTNFQAKLVSKQQEKMKQVASDNKKAGDEYRETNAKKDGVKTLDSGLQYRVIKQGDGPIPKLDDIVEVDYNGKLITGEEFDSGEGAKFALKQLIKGWQEALTMMPTGSKWEIVVPPELAYGESPIPVGPNATLVFETTLLSIEDEDSAALAQD